MQTTTCLLLCLLPGLSYAYSSGAPPSNQNCVIEKPDHPGDFQPPGTNPYTFELVELADDADGADYALRLGSDSGEMFKGILLQPSLSVDWIGLDPEQYQLRDPCTTADEKVYPISVTHKNGNEKAANVDFKFKFPEPNIYALSDLAVRVIMVKDRLNYWEEKDVTY